jgi:CheY-like chemotaxis protein
MRIETLVLVVEDEYFVRTAAVDMLEEAGFATLEAESADKAIELLEKYPDIRLVFTDVEMPGSMNGVKLVAAIKERWPPVRLVVTSGKPRPLELAAGTIFLPKPYYWPILRSKLVQALDAE